MPHAFETAEAGYGAIEDMLGGAQRAADFNLYWGGNGTVDSVIDVTHNVPVPFDSLELAGSWGSSIRRPQRARAPSTSAPTCSPRWTSPVWSPWHPPARFRRAIPALRRRTA